jgi:hypothetical protein
VSQISRLTKFVLPLSNFDPVNRIERSINIYTIRLVSLDPS